MHNVPYNCFERHVRKRSKFKNIQPVLITDKPEDMEQDTESSVEGRTTRYVEERLDDVSAEEEEAKEDKVRILVTIKMSNGFQIHRSNIDYRTLRGLVAKMDASLEEKELERKRLWALIEAKDQDNKRMAQRKPLIFHLAA